MVLSRPSSLLIVVVLGVASHCGIAFGQCNPVTDVTCTSDWVDINLTWTNGDTYETVVVFRDGVAIANLNGASTSYTDAALLPGDYEYEIQGGCGMGDWSLEVPCNISHNPICVEVTDVSCTSVGDDVNLAWTNGDTYVTIVVFRDGVVIANLNGASDSYNDVDVPDGEYQYEVQGGCGQGLWALQVLCNVTHGNPCDPAMSLGCSSNGDDVDLSWVNAETYSSLNVYRNSALIATLPGDTASFSDISVPTGLYTYAIEGQCDGTNASQTTCEIDHVAVCDPVSDLTCESVGTDVTLVWTLGEPYETIAVFRDDVAITVLNGDETSFTDSDLPEGTYIYEVQGGCGKGNWALDTSCQITHVFPCEPVIDFTCATDGESVALQWQNAEDYVNLNLYRDSVLIATLPGNTTAFSDPNLPAGTYSYDIEGDCGARQFSVLTNCSLDHAPPCESVSSLTCTSQGEGVSINWMNGEVYQNIRIVRGSDEIALLPGTATQFVDPQVPAGRHTYGVEGICDGSSASPAECVIDHNLGVSFLRADANGDGIFNGLVDSLFILSFQFQSGQAPPCMESVDVDGNGIFNGLVDTLAALTFQFQFGAPPAPPYPTCGADPDPGTSLGCLSHPGCL